MTINLTANELPMQSRITAGILKRANSAVDIQQPIIIVGEYGSGKSWLARKIHLASNRGDHPFVKVNCYTLTEDEARKKIFGYMQFTEEGVKIHPGFLKKSNEGTLFLEGFDSLSKPLQEKVLRSIECREAYHMGCSEKIPIDVRAIISIDIKSFYNSKTKFNLFSDTLTVDPYTISYPPLRQRREEIGEMVRSFLKSDLSQRYDFAATEISPRAMYQCIRYNWPGNVQQLKNAIEHASIISAGNKIQPEHLPNRIKQGQPELEELEYLEHTYSYRTAEKQLIRNVLNRSASVENSIQMLGMSKEKFEEKIKNYQMKPELT